MTPPANAIRFDATPLYRVAAELGGTCVSDVAAAGAILLQPPPAPHGPIRSTLNNDGTPLQICVTAHQHGTAVRLIGDPGAAAPSIRQRLAAGRKAIEVLFRPTSLGAVCCRILGMALPPSLDDHAQAASGILWLATPVTGSGQALYVKARWSEPGEDWQRVAALIREAMPDPLEATSTIDALRTVARPVSVGLETAGPEQTRIKIYWRLERPVALRSLGVGTIGDEAFADFLSRVMGAWRVPPSGLVFSSSFSLASGRPTDTKLDVCAHCVRRSPRQWLDIIEALAADHGLATPGIGTALEARHADIAFVGFGVGRDRDKRLNVYLKYPDPDGDPPREPELNHSSLSSAR